MSVRDQVEAAIIAVIPRGKPISITFNFAGRTLAWAEARSVDAHLSYDTRTSEWSYLGLPAIVDGTQSEPWTVQHDGSREGGVPFFTSPGSESIQATDRVCSRCFGPISGASCWRCGGKP